jgi:MFS family permease
VVAAYARVLRAPHVAVLLAASLLGRLHFATSAVAIVLLVEQRTGSYGAAGLVAGAGAVGDAVAQPLWGRRMDRAGQRRTLLTAVGVLVFVGGPLLVVLVVALASPALVLALTTLATVAGTVLFATQPPSRAAGGGELLGTAALRSRGLRTILVAATATGGVFGTLEVALPAFAEARVGDAELGVLVFAAQAAGSAAGGLLYGARATGRRVAGLYVGLVALLGPSIALLALADSLTAMVVLALLGGCVIAPMTAAGNEVIGHVVPDGRLGEAFGWLVTAVIVGAAAGNVLAGLVVEAAGWQAAILVAAGVLLAASAVVAARQETLKRPPALAQSSR